MKSIFIFLPLLILFVTGCGDKKSDIVIGKYYKVSDGLTVQYPDIPQPSEGAENEFVSSKEYRYAFPDPRNDGNVMYAIAIYKIKNDNMIEGEDKQVDYIVDIVNAAIPAFLKGNVDKVEKTEFHNKYTVRHTARIFAPFLNDKIFVNSIFFKHKEFVIRAYVFTEKQKENNDHIQAFFDNIQIE
jgi:hypothetical protein